MSESILNQAIDNLGITLDKRLLNQEFWQSTASIEDYCHAIIANFEDKASMKVKVKFGDGAHRSYDYGNNNLITLPQIPALLNKENSQEFIHKAIIFRSIVLRHELAHVLFSDWNAKSMLSKNEILTVYATVEDARVENLFSKTMRGAKYNFFRYSKPFHTINKLEIENVPSINAIFRAFMFYAQELEFEKNEITDIYKAFYEKYKSVLGENDCNAAYTTYKTMYQEAIEIIKSLRKTKENEEAEDTESNEQQESQESNEDQENEEESSEQQESNESQNDETSEEAGENENESESEEESEGEAETEEESEESNENNSSENEVENEDQESEDTSEEDQQREEEGENQQNDNGEVSVEDRDREESEEETENEEEKEEEDVENDIKDGDIMKELANEFKALTLNSEWIAMDDIDINYDTIETEISEIYASYLYKKVNGQLFSGTKGLTVYRQTTIKYQKAINDLTRLFKLKLQNRSRNHEIAYQEEGDIDQANLKEFIVSKDSPRGFIKKWKTITPSSNIMILIDASGSMVTNLQECFINACILMETCKRLNIKYQISLFTTRAASMKLRDNIRINTKMIGENIKVSNQHIFAQKNNVLLTLKRLEEKHSTTHETILGNMLDGKLSGSWMGTTPEFHSVVHIYRHYKTIKNMIFFIINDGGYDSVGAFRNYEKDILIQNINEMCVTSSVNDAIDVLHNIIDESAKVEIETEIMRYLKRYDDMIGLTVDIIKEEKINLIKEMHEMANEIKNNISSGSVKKSNIYLNWSLITQGDRKQKLSLTWDYELYYGNTNNIKDKLQRMKLSVREQLIREIRHMAKSIHFQDVAYRRYIESIRNNGWKVIGIGIRSDRGKNYIGQDQFTEVRSYNEINEKFVKGLEQLF